AHARESMATLSAIGVESISDLVALPRDGVARRFGQLLLDEIDRALGRLPDARAPFIAPERYEGQLELPAPVEEAEALLFGARRQGWRLLRRRQERGSRDATRRAPACPPGRRGRARARSPCRSSTRTRVAMATRGVDDGRARGGEECCCSFVAMAGTASVAA